MVRGLLAPGFRFHPTDVELVRYYLRRKILGKKFHFDVIAEVDIYKFNPWELVERSRLRTGDLKWYFFCPREKKYAGGARMKRATGCGYWKMTGRDRSVSYKDEVAGMIKTLVFHTGKAPNGERTDWVMYEYRLEEKGLGEIGIAQDAYVLCVVFKKDGPGPKNGAQYGAPFNEDDWNDDDDKEGEEEEEENLSVRGEISLGGTSFMLPIEQNGSIPTSLNVPNNLCNSSSQSFPSSNACLGLHPSCNSDVSKEIYQVAIVGEEVNTYRASSSATGRQCAVMLPAEPGYSNIATLIPCTSKTPDSVDEPPSLVSVTNTTPSDAYGPSQVASAPLQAPQVELNLDDEIAAMLASFTEENSEVLDYYNPSESDPLNIYNDLEDLDMAGLVDKGHYLELMDLDGPLDFGAEDDLCESVTD